MPGQRFVLRESVVRVALVALVAACAGAATAATGGDPSAALLARELATVDGRPATLAAWEGQVLVVNFWASWCAPCRRELAQLDAWNADWESRGARVVAVSLDNERERARRFAADRELGLTVLHDGPDGLARELDLSAVPTTYLLDRDGAIVLEVQGSDERQLEQLRVAVERLLERRAGRAGL